MEGRRSIYILHIVYASISENGFDLIKVSNGVDTYARAEIVEGESNCVLDYIYSVLVTLVVVLRDLINANGIKCGCVVVGAWQTARVERLTRVAFVIGMRVYCLLDQWDGVETR